MATMPLSCGSVLHASNARRIPSVEAFATRYGTSTGSRSTRYTDGFAGSADGRSSCDSGSICGSLLRWLNTSSIELTAKRLDRRRRMFGMVLPCAGLCWPAVKMKYLART